MGMPSNLVLIRHGQSEMNFAHQRDRDGDSSFLNETLQQKHSSQWRLTDFGREQIHLAGEWIRAHMCLDFSRYYTSTHIRAMESAALLDLPEARWFASILLREREWGAMEALSERIKHGMYAQDMQYKKANPLYWRPPRGESIADVCMRVDRVLQTLHRECDGKNVIIVCHGEVMWAFRMCIERMTDTQYNDLDASDAPWDRIHNGQIIQYTRVNPTGDGALSPYVGWRRSVTPWDHDRSSGMWETITRPHFSNEELLAHVGQIPQIVR